MARRHAPRKAPHPSPSGARAPPEQIRGRLFHSLMLAHIGSPRMSTTTLSPADESQRCRLCDTELLPSAKQCPRCGLPVRSAQLVRVRTRDVILTIIMATLAAIVTVPVTFLVTARLITSGFFGSNLTMLFLIGTWNCFILGFPIVILARRWVSRVRKGDFERGWMWRDYWYFQALAFSPLVGGMAALYVFSAVMDFVLWIVGVATGP